MSVTVHYRVAGMTCDHCVSAVRAELTRLPGVREVSVELATGAVTVAADQPVPLNAIRTAVDDAGYELAGVDA